MSIRSIFYNPITSSVPFKAAINTLDWIKTTGISNAVIKPLGSIRKIAERFNYSIPETSLVGTLFPLTKPAKNLFSFVEMFTKLVDIGRTAQKALQEFSSGANFHQSTYREYVVNTTLSRADQETKESWESRVKAFNLYPNFDSYKVWAKAYHTYDLLDHVASVSNAAADWLMSCADWTVFRNPSCAKDNAHWTAYAFPWSGRVLSLTNLLTEARFLWRATRSNTHSNKSNTVFEGTTARQELIASVLKTVFFASFIALDVLGIMAKSQRFKGQSWIEPVSFWISQAQTILMPLAINWYPKVGLEPLRFRSGEILTPKTS